MGDWEMLGLSLAGAVGSVEATGCSELLLLETSSKMGPLSRHDGLSMPRKWYLHAPGSKPRTNSSASPVVT